MIDPFKERHVDALKFFIYLFIGMVSAYTLFFVMLPETIVSKLFNIQLETINQINSDISSSLTGNYMGDLFSIILINNLKVMVFALLFSFIYGSGAIFILTWNASVISVAIGFNKKTNLCCWRYNGGCVCNRIFYCHYYGFI